MNFEANLTANHPTVPPITALVDFADPRDPAAPRLRQAFGRPSALWQAQRPEEVPAVLAAAESAAAAGAWCLGFVAYEAASAFDAALVTHAPDSAQGPLAWFAAYDQPLPWPEGEDALATAAPWLDWAADLDRPAFDAALTRIQAGIAAGEAYQVNFTGPLRAALSPDEGPDQGRLLFAALQRAQPGGYAAWIDTAAAQRALAETGAGQGAATEAPGIQILSVSPELFFDWRGDAILARPMKGTAPRGATPEEDAALAQGLRDSPKERAENVMIVDLLRNDLSRIAQPHSVQVPALLQTQALPSVWQMTSDVTARVRPDTRLADVFAALFPCGSVTGAPKVQAMQTIRTLEPAPRGVYCGAIGLLRPEPDPKAPSGAVRATFNVPIRTVVLQGDQAVCSIGSGITSGAEAPAEWAEWGHKRTFLERANAGFELLETLALDEGRLRHLPDHLARMHGAARHFGFPWPEAAVVDALQALATAHPEGLWRVRLRLDAYGQPTAEAYAATPTPSQVRLQLADRPFLATHSAFVRYKTTRRDHYAAFAPHAPGVFDTILWNAAGELTETTFGNLAVLINGEWVTPPVACGLLPGVGRTVALREGRLCEAVVRLGDLPRVQGWAFVNSLRGWIGATCEVGG